MTVLLVLSGVSGLDLTQIKKNINFHFVRKKIVI